ncbi:MAG TPA: hypothetical protein VKA10_10825 [Prolixibacteraceae bacterium]|nr:hypothetical protein [Prolixibacteraceae bacterium]
MDIVQVTMKVKDVEKFKHECECSEHLTFEVAKMQQSNQFGHTHTAYVTIIQKSEAKN